MTDIKSKKPNSPHDEFYKQALSNLKVAQELFDKENKILKCAENAICSSKSIIKDKCFNNHLDNFIKSELGKQFT